MFNARSDILRTLVPVTKELEKKLDVFSIAFKSTNDEEANNNTTNNNNNGRAIDQRSINIQQTTAK
jgi:predicted CopG family antitoxin